MKNIIALTAAFALVSTVFFSCASAEQKRIRELKIDPIDLSSVADGSHDGEFSYGSFTYRVRVETRAGKIDSVSILDNRDTPHAKKAEGVVARVLAEQRVDVDAVSGATTTSKALLQAIASALHSAR